MQEEYYSSRDTYFHEIEKYFAESLNLNLKAIQLLNSCIIKSRLLNILRPYVGKFHVNLVYDTLAK